MKKILSAIAALTVCAAMLAGCTGSGTPTTVQDEAATTSAAAAADAGDDSIKDETDTEDEDSTDEGSDENADDTYSTDDNGEVPAYASIDEFVNSDYTSLDYEQIGAKESLTFEFTKTIAGIKEVYMDVESTDGTMAMMMAFDSNNNIAMSASGSGVDAEINIIITDMVMYMLDPATKTGLYYAVDESIFDEYNTDEILGSLDVDVDSFSDSEKIGVCKVQIDGKEYVFEYSEEAKMGYLFETDGNLVAIAYADNTYDFDALVINEFSGNVPAGVYDIPDDYELVDLSEFMNE